MSSFAEFGMTRDAALAEAKKRTKSTHKYVKAPGDVEPVPLVEWLELVEKKIEQIMGGTVRQLSPLFDDPQYAEQFIELARRTIQCRDLRIKTQGLPGDYIISHGADGKPLTKTQQVHMCGNRVSPAPMEALAAANNPWSKADQLTTVA